MFSIFYYSEKVLSLFCLLINDQAFKSIGFLCCVYSCTVCEFCVVYLFLGFHLYVLFAGLSDKAILLTPPFSFLIL
jgi:hypothetical protein